jgi:hypothetical protein
MAFDNMAQRGEYGLGRDQEILYSRKLHNENLLGLYSLLYLIRVIK